MLAVSTGARVSGYGEKANWPAQLTRLGAAAHLV